MAVRQSRSKEPRGQRVRAASAAARSTKRRHGKQRRRPKDEDDVR
jgi:hypothetical protein